MNKNYEYLSREEWLDRLHFPFRPREIIVMKPLEEKAPKVKKRKSKHKEVTDEI